MNEVIFSRQVKEVKFGSWTLELSKQTISDGDVERELEPLLFKLLCYFILNNEHIVTRQNLVDDVWCQNYVDDNAINRAMSELRKILKSERQKGIVVKTHYRKGYSFFLEPTIIHHASEVESSENNASKVKEQPIKKPSLSNKKKSKSLVKRSVIVTFFSALLVIGIYHTSLFDNHVKVTTSEIEEDVLSWLPGRYDHPSLSPDKQQIAYSFVPNDTEYRSLVVKTLNSGQEKRFGEQGANYLPVGWSVDSNEIFYRVTTETKCQIWRVSADFNSDNQFLFDCNLNYHLTGGGGGDGHFIYSKTGYRNRGELSSLTNRNLATGDEFQITSPNLNSFGDHFLSYIPSKELIIFERRQYDVSELYVTDPDGGNQEKLFESIHRIWSINYDKSTGLLTWFDNSNNMIYHYDLSGRKLVNQIELNTEKTYGLSQPVDTNSLLLVSYPFLIDVYRLDLDTKELRPVDKSGHEDQVGIEVENGHLVLTRKGGYKEIYFIEDGKERQLIDIPKGRFSSIRYNYKTNQLLLRYKDKIELYDYKSLNLLDTINVDGAVISAEFLDSNQIGYVVIDDKKIKSKAFKYVMSDKKRVEVPALTSLWIGHLDDTTLVSLSSNDTIDLYDVFSGDKTHQYDLPQAIFQHTVAIGQGVIYYSDGEKIYEINRDTSNAVEEIYGFDSTKYILRGIQYSETTGNILIDLVEFSDGQLLKVTLKK